MEHPEPKLSLAPAPKAEAEASADCAMPYVAPPAHPPPSLIAATVSNRLALTGLLGLGLVACGGGGGNDAYQSEACRHQHQLQH